MNYKVFGFFLAYIIGVGKCDSCEKGFLQGSTSECIPYVTEYNGACVEEAQCEWLGDNSECKGGYCNCIPGYHWYLGECHKYVDLGGDCEEDLDCFDGYNLQSLTCVSGKCSCSEDYYLRDNIDCRKKATAINATCALNIDCQVPNNETDCVIGKCKLPSTSSSLDEDIEDFFLNEEVSIFSALTPISCTVGDNNCTVDNSECYEKTGTCVCKKQYFSNEEGTECLAEVGVNVGCTTDADCKLKPGHCVDGVCFCRDYYFVDEMKRNCVKTMSETNWNCLSREWCYALGKYSFCNSTGVCSCSVVSDYDKEHEECVPNGNESPVLCSKASDCNYIDGGDCINEQCGCPDGYLQNQNDICLPNKIGVPCQQKECQVVDSVCVDDICQCVGDYVAVDGGCHSDASDLGDPCSMGGQCSVQNSQCLNETCACNDDYTPYENKCYETKEFSSYCNTQFDCTLSLGESVQCRNRMCQCPTGSTMKEDKCSSGIVTKGSILFIALILKGVLLVFG